MCERSEREDGWKVEGAADPQSKKANDRKHPTWECHVGKENGNLHYSSLWLEGPY